jgi:hypothetical protein
LRRYAEAELAKKRKREESEREKEANKVRRGLLSLIVRGCDGYKPRTLFYIQMLHQKRFCKAPPCIRGYKSCSA